LEDVAWLMYSGPETGADVSLREGIGSLPPYVVAGTFTQTDVDQSGRPARRQATDDWDGKFYLACPNLGCRLQIVSTHKTCARVLTKLAAASITEIEMTVLRGAFDRMRVTQPSQE
jgi:hypothetical protein